MATNSSSTPPAVCLLSLENGYLRMDWWDRASAGGHPQNVHYPLAARVGCGPGFANGDLIGVTIDARANTLAFDLNGDRTGFGIAARLPPQPDTRKGRGSGGRTVCAAVEMEEPEQEVELL